MKRLKILHIIGSLDVGGTQVALYKLLAHADRSRADYKVVSLIAGGALEDSFTQMSIPVISLGMNSNFSAITRLCRLGRLLAVERPDVVVTWMYHANLLGGVAARIFGKVPVVWNIRNSGAEVSPYRPMTRLVVQLGKFASHALRPTIAFVSDASRLTHSEGGFSSANSLVVPNGFDTSVFRPDAEARHAVRAELMLAPDSRLVGIVARVHPDKDHSNFIRAARLLHRELKDAHFVFCGDGASTDNQSLVRQLNDAGVRQVAHLLGRRFDIPRITAGLDVSVLSSSAEAFPNAVGEAMSCAVPCVVTDVGDSARLVGNTGRVVPPRDSAALAAAIHELLSLPQARLREVGNAARNRIVDQFSIEKVVRQYEGVWLSAATAPQYSQRSRKAA